MIHTLFFTHCHRQKSRIKIAYQNADTLQQWTRHKYQKSDLKF